MYDKYEEVSFSQKMFTNGLHYLNSRNSVQNKDRRAHLKFWLTEELPWRTFPNNWKFLKVRHTKLCTVILPFLRSVDVGLSKCWSQCTRPHTATRIVETINQFGLKQLPYPLYNLDLARPIGWGCKIHRLHLCRRVKPPANDCPGYDTKLSVGEDSVLELWGMWRTLPFQYSQVHSVAPDRVLFMGQIELLDI